MPDDVPVLKGWAWIKGGYTASDGSLDDARLSATALVVGFIVFAFYAIKQAPPQNLQEVAETIKNFGIGAGALSAGVGGWFGFRKDN